MFILRSIAASIISSVMASGAIGCVEAFTGTTGFCEPGRVIWSSVIGLGTRPFSMPNTMVNSDSGTCRHARRR